MIFNTTSASTSSTTDAMMSFCFICLVYACTTTTPTSADLQYTGLCLCPSDCERLAAPHCIIYRKRGQPTKHPLGTSDNACISSAWAYARIPAKDPIQHSPEIDLVFQIARYLVRQVAMNLGRILLVLSAASSHSCQDVRQSSNVLC